MSREIHVRFCESLKGRFLWATHLRDWGENPPVYSTYYSDGAKKGRDLAMKLEKPAKPSPDISVRRPFLPNLAAAIVFILGTALAVIFTWDSEQNRLEIERARASHIAGDYAHELEVIIERALSVTYSLAALVRQGKGRFTDFEATANELLSYYPGVNSLQLAPNGIVQQITPLAGNEKAIGHDLLKDPARTKEAFLARETGKLTLAGPFNLLQGGVGAVGRLPVFISNGTGGSTFWGFTNAMIRFPDVLNSAHLSRLMERGFQYELWRINPDTGERQSIITSSALLVKPVESSLELPNGIWTLSIAPSGGWGNPSGLTVKAVLGLVFSLLLSLLTYSLLNARFKALQLADRLTLDLRESEKNFRTFFDTMDYIILVSSQDGNICYSNPAASKKLGYSQDELEKMCMVEVRPSEMRQEAEECFSAICKGEVNACPLPLQSKTGVIIPSQSTCWLGQWDKTDSIFFISRDLSKEQEALQKFNRLFNNNPALMSVVSLPDRKFTDVNDAFINALGFSREEILGKTSKELNIFINQEESRRFAEEFKKKGGLLNSEYLIRCKNGEILDGIFSGEVIESQGQQFSLIVMIDQTRRKQTEKALRESEERFRSMFDNSLDGIVFTTPDGIIFAANPAICKMLGFSEQEICEGGRDLVVDKTDPRVAHALQEVELTGEFTGEIFHRRKDGVSFPIEISTKVFSSEKGDKRIVIVYRDVTERKIAEDKLTKVMREQQTILDTANIGITMVKDRVQKWVNQKAIDILQYSREEMEGMPTRKLYPSQEEYEHLGRNAYPVLAQGHVYKIEQQLLRRDGTLIWIRLNGKAIVPSDLSMGTIWLLEDITEQRAADENLKATLYEKEILLREVHHRVKNNMQMISSLLALQAERVKDEPLQQVFIESQQRILAMAMIHETLHSGKSLAFIDLADYLKRLVSHLQGVYNSQAAVGVILELEKVELNIDLVVPCGLIINELLTNAFKHAFPGGNKGTITIKNYLVNERELVLEVSDNGVGLPLDFDLETPSSLGLKLVKGLLKHQLQGNWDVTLGKGATFILRWPLPVLKGERV